MNSFNGGIFKGDLFNGGIFTRSSGWSPLSLFANGEYGAWLDVNDLSLLYTTDIGSTHVAAVSDQIGRAETKSGGTVNALQATSSLRPILGQWPSGGRYYVYHDRVDDKLTLAAMPSGTYTIGAAGFSGVQIYEIIFSSGTLAIPAIDFTELLIINKSLNATEKSNLSVYLLTKAPAIGATDIARVYCSISSVNLSISESGGSSDASWELGDGQTATGTSCVKTITPPKSIILRANNPSKISSILWGSKGIYGQIPYIDKLTGLTTFWCHLNQLTGSIPPLSANTALTSFYCHANQLTGSIPPLSANTALITFWCYSNQLTGSIPSLSANTALTSFRCELNQLTGNIPSLSANTALITFWCYSNQLTGYSGGAFPATLGDFNAQSNNFDANGINSVLAAAVSGGRTSASGTCTLLLNGSGMPAPTGQGITDKATLISRGWTVNTN